MRLSEILQMFNGSISINQFRHIIAIEIKEYKSSLSVKGKSTPIYLIEDIGNLFVGKKELIKACNLFLSSELNKSEIAYVAEALILSSRVDFENEDIRESIELLTDPDVNGILTEKTIQNILEPFQSP